MAKSLALLGALVLAGGCGPVSTNCTCVAVGACTTANQATETCGVGMICCPPVADGGPNSGVSGS